MRRECLGYAALGQSYAAVVRQGQWWRCVTATFAHVSFWHLALNTYSLLGYGWAEEQMGSFAFLHTTALLALLAPPVSWVHMGAAACGRCRCRAA